MKNKRQKFYTYVTIFALPLVIGLLSYPFHKSEEFKIFYSLKSKEDFKVADNNISRILSEVKKSSPETGYYLSIGGSLLDFSQVKYFNENRYAVFVDARSAYEIDDEMIDPLNKIIPNAISIPVDYLDSIRDEGYFDGEAELEIIKLDYEKEIDTIQLLDKLPKKIPYIVYCGSSDCDKSENLADYMVENFGFKNVSIYKGGWQEWKENKIYD